MSESSDCDQMNDWTMIDSVGDTEDGQPGDSSVEEIAIAEGEVQNADVMAEEVRIDQDEVLHNVASQLVTESIQLEDKIRDILPGNADDEPVAPVIQPMCSCRHSRESSDIELIPDDVSCNGAVEDGAFSQASTYSLMNESVGERDVDAESHSSGSSISVLPELDDLHTDLSTMCSSKAELPVDLTVERVRSYTHTPNPRLNVALNFLLVLSVTLCFGLGIGHFVGWSSRWIHQQHLHKTHITNLKVLQSELLECLQNPGLVYVGVDGRTNACYEKVDYWQRRFDDILSENKVLHDFVDKSTSESGDEDEKCEETNPAMVADYRQLKFHLIKQQLANVATLKHVEVLKRQEQEALDRVRLLEAEREKLRARVAEEEAEEEEDEEVIRQLTEENRELKREVVDLRVAVEMEVEEEDASTLEELSTLRQKIGQLKAENGELKLVVARLRYSRPPLMPHPPSDATTNDATPQNQNPPPTPTIQGMCGQKANIEPTRPLQEDSASPKQTPSRSGHETEPKLSGNENEDDDDESSNLLDSVLTSWLLNSVNELNLTGFLDYLTKVATDKPTAQREIRQLRDNLLTGYDQLSKQARAGFDSGRQIASRVQDLLRDKWRDAMEAAGNADARMPTEAIQVIHDAVKSTLDKVYKMGAGILEPGDSDADSGGSDGGAVDGATAKLQKQVDKLVAGLEKRWDAIYDRVWGSKKGKEGSSKGKSKNDAVVSTASDDLISAARVDDNAQKKAAKKERERVKKLAKRELKVRKVRGGSRLKSKEENREKEESLLMVKVEEIGKEEKGWKSERAEIQSLSINHAHVKHVDSNANEMDKASCPKSGESENVSLMVDSGEDVLMGLEDGDDDDNDDELNKSDGSNKAKLRSKSKIDSENATATVKNSGDWVFARAGERKAARHSKRRGDWIFDRAQDRQHARKEAEKADWYFDRARGRYERRSDDTQKSEKRSTKKQNKQKKKETSKSKKEQRSDDDSEADSDSDDEVEQKKWSKHEQRRYRYRNNHQQAFDWAIPDLRNYQYSS